MAYDGNKCMRHMVQLYSNSHTYTLSYLNYCLNVYKFRPAHTDDDEDD